MIRFIFEKRSPLPPLPPRPPTHTYKKNGPLRRVKNNFDSLAFMSSCLRWCHHVSFRKRQLCASSGAIFPCSGAFTYGTTKEMLRSLGGATWNGAAAQITPLSSSGLSWGQGFSSPEVNFVKHELSELRMESMMSLPQSLALLEGTGGVRTGGEGGRHGVFSSCPFRVRSTP